MVVPIYDDNPFTQPVKPVVTWCLIAANLAVFVYEAGAGQLALDRMIDTFSLTPAAFSGDMGARGWLPAFATLITYEFLHADIAHLLGNMVFLWVFGDDVERALGRWRYLAFYLLSGVGGGLVFIANDPHSGIELIGASGAIAGVVVAYVMLRPCAKITVLLGIIPLRISAYWVVGLFALASCGIWARPRRARSPIGAISAACWRGGPVPVDEAVGSQAVPVPAAGARIRWCRSDPIRAARAARSDNLR